MNKKTDLRPPIRPQFILAIHNSSRSAATIGGTTLCSAFDMEMSGEQ
jgi:hypothetical protein